MSTSVALGGNSTLDLEHEKMLKAIQANRERGQKVMDEMDELDRMIAEIDAMQDVSERDYERRSDLINRRCDLCTFLKSHSRTIDDIQYYTNTANILFDYYDLIDKGKGKQQPPPPLPAHSHHPHAKSILSYFSQEHSPAGKSRTDAQPQPRPEHTHTTRGSLLEKYHRCMGSEFKSRSATTAIQPTPVHHDMHNLLYCTHCKQEREFLLQIQEGYRYCGTCFSVDYILVDHEKPSYKDPPKDISYFAYKRVNHFNEWLAQIQGRETTEIPDDVYDRILLEIKKQKITNMALVTKKKLREILKKLRINKYFEHCPHILNQLNGIQSPQLPPELEDRLRHMFCQIQVPFLKHAPISRKNFLSYSYVLNKMMQLLEQDEYLDSFPLLKSREKLHQQDKIWKSICEEVGWHFIPSL